MPELSEDSAEGAPAANDLIAMNDRGCMWHASSTRKKASANVLCRIVVHVNFSGSQQAQVSFQKLHTEARHRRRPAMHVLHTDACDAYRSQMAKYCELNPAGRKVDLRTAVFEKTNPGRETLQTIAAE
eukprot:6203574-Pleurochrysis_carterae.AAC.1